MPHLAPHAMAMPKRQRDVLSKTILAARAAGLYASEEVIVFNAREHKSMHGFSSAFSQRFGHLVATGQDALLTHAGASLSDRKDSLGLPIQAVGFTRQRCVILLRAVGAHRLVGEAGEGMNSVLEALKAAGVGPVLVEPWGEAQR